jgi:hypothetical protein
LNRWGSYRRTTQRLVVFFMAAARLAFFEIAFDLFCLAAKKAVSSVSVELGLRTRLERSYVVGRRVFLIRMGIWIGSWIQLLFISDQARILSKIT